MLDQANTTETRQLANAMTQLFQRLFYHQHRPLASVPGLGWSSPQGKHDVRVQLRLDAKNVLEVRGRFHEFAGNPATALYCGYILKDEPIVKPVEKWVAPKGHLWWRKPAHTVTQDVLFESQQIRLADEWVLTDDGKANIARIVELIGSAFEQDRQLRLAHASEQLRALAS